MILIESSTISTTVEPALEVSLPPSIKISIRPEKYSLASCAVRAGGFPEGFALVAVSGAPRAWINSAAIGWLDRRTPIPPVGFTSGRGISRRAGNTMVNRPGQERALDCSDIRGSPD